MYIITIHPLDLLHAFDLVVSGPLRVKCCILCILRALCRWGKDHSLLCYLQVVIFTRAIIYLSAQMNTCRFYAKWKVMALQTVMTVQNVFGNLLFSFLCSLYDHKLLHSLCCWPFAVFEMQLWPFVFLHYICGRQESMFTKTMFYVVLWIYLCHKSKCK